ncbi:MAG: tetratricopeptide repeat protein [Chloroflexia bacterium]
MAGNKTIYDTAMKRAHEYAWSNQWDRALKEYGRALAEFPNDRTAQRNMAQCMFTLRQWPKAMTAYENLLNTDPTDAFAINRLAEIYLALGQKDRAQLTYDRLADLYLKNNQLHEAIRALRDLSRAMPKNKTVHERLLDLTQEVDDKAAQAAEHLALSQIALDASSLGEAQQHADAAAALDADNPDIRRWVYTVRRRLAETAGTVSLAEGFMEDRDDQDPRHQIAPGTHLLTGDVVESPEVEALVMEATRLSSAGDFGRAMELYDNAVRAGAKRPAIFYSAGVLNQQMGHPEQAIALLERAVQDREFAMSANYVLGQCYMALGNPPKAVTAFERALTLVEADKLTKAEADELIELYRAAAQAHLADNNPGRAASLFSALASTFKAKKWSHPQLADIEKKADELYKKSIQSKLLGISRGGSTLLDPEALSDAEQGNGKKPRANAELEQPTRHLPAGTGFVHDDNGVERPTTKIAAPGGNSNLRSITEYLRASDTPTAQPIPEEAAPAVAVASRGEDDETVALRRATPATELLPLTHSTADQHVIVDMPYSAIIDKEQRGLAVQVLIAEGEHALSESKWVAAIDSCLTVIGLESDYLPIHMMLGDIYLHQSKTEDAITKYQTVMDTYIARREPEKAAEVCERLLRLEPDNPALQTRYGVLLMEAGRVDDAARALLVAAERYHLAGDTRHALDEALTLKASLPNSSDVALAVGTYQLILGELPPAIMELSRALHLNPGNGTALVRLYATLVQSRDDAQWDALQSLLERSNRAPANTRLFMEELHMALKRDPDPTYHYALGVLAGRADMQDIAADALDQGLLMISLGEEQPDDIRWQLVEVLMAQYRADIAINAREWGLAARHYTRALELLQPAPGEQAKIASPRPQYDFVLPADPVQLYYGLAEAHASQNNWDGALKSLKSLKSLMPDDHGVHTRLSDIYFRQGNLTEALSELNEVLVYYQKHNENEKTLETLGHMAKLAPNNVPVRRKLSDLYLKLGMTDHGLTELNTLAELQLKAGLLKDAIQSYQKAADLYYTLGQHDKAISIYEKIVRIAPRDLNSRDQLVNMYIQSGMMKEAIASERSLADLFIQEGRTEDAIAALHQLIALSPDDMDALHILAKQLTAISEYGQAARLYGRLARLQPDNDHYPVLQTEMQRLADEEAAAKKASNASKKQAKQAAAVS